eukprot:42181-Rhodomonas_salina.1
MVSALLCDSSHGDSAWSALCYALSVYARATRCPVLTWCMVTAQSSSTVAQVSNATSLRASYAMSGTDTAHSATVHAGGAGMPRFGTGRMPGEASNTPGTEVHYGATIALDKARYFR